MSQATVESVTAYQLALRRAKKERNEKEKAAAELGSKNNSIDAGSGEHDPFKVEQIIYLQDFPRTFEDVKELVKFGFTKLNCVNIIEELFNREIEDETDDVEPTAVDKSPSQEVIETNDKHEKSQELEEPQAPPEKLFNKMYERVTVFEDVIQINRFLKT